MTFGRRIGAWLAWYAALFWFWMLLVGAWNRIEIVAALCVASVAAAVAEYVRAKAGLHVRIPLTWLARAKTVPLSVFTDFGVVMWVLLRAAARRERPHGTFRVKEFSETQGEASGFGARAFVTMAATLSPNAYVIDIDRDEGLVLLHTLVPLESSEEPA